MEHPIQNVADDIAIHPSFQPQQQRNDTVLCIVQPSEESTQIKQKTLAPGTVMAGESDSAFPASDATSGSAQTFVGDGNQVEVKLDLEVEMEVEPCRLVKHDSVDEMTCRICHLSLLNYLDCGEAIELGCVCKHDLAVAHSRCAEAWFKIRGNRTCEICGATASNIIGVEMEVLTQTQERGLHGSQPSHLHWWNRMPLCNLLTSLFITAVLLPWLFHINLYR